MIETKDISITAESLGACRLTHAITDWRSAVNVMFSPQGREFCKAHGYPTAEQFRQMPDLQSLGVYVDAGEIDICCDKDICIVGDTQARVFAAENTSLHRLLVFHGASAQIIASNYSVTNVTNIGGKIKAEITDNAKVFEQ